MTPHDKTEALATRLKQHVEPLSLEIEGRLAEYDVAMKERGMAIDNRQHYESAATASKEAAKAVSQHIRSCLTLRNVDAKEVRKTRAVRAGHLEDVEINESLVSEASISIATAELRASRAAGEIKGLMRTARDDAAKVLSERIASTINADFPAVACFVNLVAEIAERGDSAIYNVNPSCFEPTDFALGELSKIIRSALGRRDRELGSKTFLPELPENIGGAVRSPLAMQKMQTEIDAMAAAL